MQLGQVLGLFFLPGGRPRLLLVSDTSAGSDLGIMISSGTDSVVDSMGTDIEVGISCGNSAGEEYIFNTFSISKHFQQIHFHLFVDKNRGLKEATEVAHCPFSLSY